MRKTLLPTLLLFSSLFAFVTSGRAQTAPPCPTGKTCSGSVTFTVTLPPPGTPGAVSPASVVAGAAATTITLTATSGSTFNAQMAVEACQITPAPCTTQTDLATTFVDSTHLTAVLPVALLANSGTLAIYLSQPLNAHSVGLSWNASSSAVAGYNMYRSIVSGSGYAKINSMLIAALTYVDWMVQNTTTYYYVATAVDSAGNESVFSNEVSAPIP